jgi:four helix bundle protein
MSYKKLEVWQEARAASIKIHEMSFTLPKFELFEGAQQIRRSSKSVRSNIVEGYGRRKYKQDFIRFLVIALASNDETIDHLETLFETKSLTDKQLFEEFHYSLQRLGKKLNNFLHAVERDHNTTFINEPEAEYFNSISSNGESNGINSESEIQIPSAIIKNPESNIKYRLS